MSCPCCDRQLLSEARQRALALLEKLRRQRDELQAASCSDPQGLERLRRAIDSAEKMRESIEQALAEASNRSG